MKISVTGSVPWSQHSNLKLSSVSSRMIEFLYFYLYWTTSQQKPRTHTPPSVYLFIQPSQPLFMQSILSEWPSMNQHFLLCIVFWWLSEPWSTLALGSFPKFSHSTEHPCIHSMHMWHSVTMPYPAPAMLYWGNLLVYLPSYHTL